jgi:UDP-N-acetylglucosamine 4,6-dehydratase
VPRIPSVRLPDLAEAIAPGAEQVDVGIRPGEKLHEEMIAVDDARRTFRTGDRYVVMPYLQQWREKEPVVGEPVEDDFAYRSDTNEDFLDVDGVRKVLGQVR